MKTTDERSFDLGRAASSATSSVVNVMEGQDLRI